MSGSAAATSTWRALPGAVGGAGLHGVLRVPGDKSISHRAVMLGAIAHGRTAVSGLLEGADVLATIAALRQLGVTIEGPEQGRLLVHGAGREALQAPSGALDLGNSGTSMRLLAGMLSGLPFPVALTGDRSLQRRPMQRVTEPLGRMGAQIDTAEGGTAPLRLRPGAILHGIDYDMPVASAQVKSALLLAGLFAQGQTRVTEPAPTRDHTERMLSGFGYVVERQGASVALSGGGRLTATAIDVPADISSAAFPMVAATLVPGSEVILKHVGWNPTRTGVVEILRQMGADIEVLSTAEVGGEPVADLRVRAAALRGIHIPEALVPLAIDEFPVLFVAAACAEGETRLTGAAELRVKESDRIAVMAEGLQALGVQAEVHDDGMHIVGRPALQGGRVDSYGDHRIAMAFAVAALRAETAVIIDDCANVATSFPGFVEQMAAIGLAIEAQ
ncbi:3-phosphoshikimate 1-carboxyvinyltransferase [Halorhodospira abdelmalekii]|uniref:3-phosphoshikimate 1-carboxyvinyltransferase n=1 Tax=Halorhodospira abdelmalekii TaxID=421629 RepID=UPI001907FD37|nr:3-phosphoshikimate 1-carboxyvinyltransferase [Halorhodospira abdelmalekii]MBK1734516.1 3-phosphoshikimate 1-carboxyvinyltransferase [Halorhodospira abdelmalekii]